MKQSEQARTIKLRSFVINPRFSFGQISIFSEIQSGAELGESFSLKSSGHIAEYLFDRRVFIRLRRETLVTEMARVTIFIDVDIDIATEHSSSRIESFNMMNLEHHFQSPLVQPVGL